MTSVPVLRPPTRSGLYVLAPGPAGSLASRARSWAVAMLVAAMLIQTATPLRAQVRHILIPPPPPPLLAFARNDLSFGTVLPGIPVAVPARDARAGLFEIDGPVSASVRVDFVLPIALTSSGGALLPVHFGSGDGLADFSNGAHGQIFNPHTPLIGTLSSTGRLFVRMGGSVAPALPQAGGSYHASIFMTVANLGI